MELARQVFFAIFSVTSIWSVVARGVFWLVIAIVIIASTNSASPEQSMKSLKSNLGFLLLFLSLSVGLLYLLFGYAPSA